MSRLRGKKSIPGLGTGPGVVLCIGDEPVRLNLRCLYLKDHGWRVICSGTAHEGIILFSDEVDVAILDLDAAEASLIAGEMKRLRPQVPIIILTRCNKVLGEDTAPCGDVVVPNWDQTHLLRALASLGRKSDTT